MSEDEANFLKLVTRVIEERKRLEEIPLFRQFVQDLEALESLSGRLDVEVDSRLRVRTLAQVEVYQDDGRVRAVAVVGDDDAGFLVKGGRAFIRVGGVELPLGLQAEALEEQRYNNGVLEGVFLLKSGD